MIEAPLNSDRRILPMLFPFASHYHAGFLDLHFERLLRLTTLQLRSMGLGGEGRRFLFPGTSIKIKGGKALQARMTRERRSNKQAYIRGRRRVFCSEKVVRLRMIGTAAFGLAIVAENQSNNRNGIPRTLCTSCES